MKWILNLLNKPEAKRATPSSVPIPRGIKPPEDVEWLRNALAVADHRGEHKQLAARLGRALTEHSLSPHPEEPPEVWVAAICNASDKALALSWSADLAGETWLGQVASEARLAEVRYACAQRIESTAALEQVAQATRGKDKRVYRYCADLLEQRRQAEVSAHRADEIAGELRSLLDGAPLPHTSLLQLKKQLDALKDAGEPGLRCEALVQRALARLQQEAEARRNLHTCQGAAASLTHEWGNAIWPWSEQINNWSQRLDSLKRAYSALPAWLAIEAGGRALGQSLGELDARLGSLAADAERAVLCEQFLGALVDARMPPSANTSMAWDALVKPEHPEARASLELRWQALNQSLSPVPESESAPALPPAPRPRIDHTTTCTLLDKLERAIAQGQLADASATAAQLKDTLGNSRLPGTLEARLHRLHAQLEGLRGWARWGTAQVRENLIAAAGELLMGDRDVQDLGLAIAALRDEWKRLNAHGAATKAQWASFDGILEKAYQPVAAHRAEAALRQAEARVTKEAMCTGWEADIAAMVWEHADFKVVEAQRAEMLKRWRASAQAGFRDERALRKRFDMLTSTIDARLDAARVCESKRRNELVTAAEALREQPDLEKAMADARVLQGRWNQQPTPVRLGRKDEERLWQRFRAACNAVFERRTVQRNEHESQRVRHTESRQLLLDAFAATLASADDKSIKPALTQFRADWAMSRRGSRETADRLDTLATELEQLAQKRLDDLHREKYRSQLELLAQRAALAAHVEATALAGGPVETVVAEAKLAWEKLPALPGDTENLLTGRLAGASAITFKDLEAGREAREGLLLDLEIVLGLPSPQGCAAARRQRQLERLQSRFGAATTPAAEPEMLLARCYATAALPDADFDRRIEVIVRQLGNQASPSQMPAPHR
ncbi:MAG: DUF349 domain-containing protein [Thiobacillaceae bacterium]